MALNFCSSLAPIAQQWTSSKKSKYSDPSVVNTCNMLGHWQVQFCLKIRLQRVLRLVRVVAFKIRGLSLSVVILCILTCTNQCAPVHESSPESRVPPSTWTEHETSCYLLIEACASFPAPRMHYMLAWYSMQYLAAPNNSHFRSNRKIWQILANTG